MDVYREKESESCARVLDLVLEVCDEDVIKDIRCGQKQVMVMNSYPTPSNGQQNHFFTLLDLGP